VSAHRAIAFLLLSLLVSSTACKGQDKPDGRAVVEESPTPAEPAKDEGAASSHPRAEPGGAALDDWAAKCVARLERARADLTAKLPIFEKASVNNNDSGVSLIYTGAFPSGVYRGVVAFVTRKAAVGDDFEWRIDVPDTGAPWPVPTSYRYFDVVDQMAVVRDGGLIEEDCPYEQVIAKLTPRSHPAEDEKDDSWRIVWKLRVERIRGTLASIDINNMRIPEVDVILPLLRSAVDDCLAVFPVGTEGS